MPLKSVCACGVVGLCSVASAQVVAVDPDGVGATDVLARPLGSGVPFAPVPLDANGVFAGVDTELLVGATADGEILFHDAGTVRLLKTIGRDAGSSGRVVVAGDTTVFGLQDSLAGLSVGREGVGELVVTDGASWVIDGNQAIQIGSFAPGRLVVSGGASFDGPLNPLALEIGGPRQGGNARPPADGRMSRFLATGEGTTVTMANVSLAVAMDAEFVVDDGARVDVSQSLQLGPPSGAVPRGEFTAKLHVRNAELGEVTVLSFEAQNSSVLIEDGGRLSVRRMFFSTNLDSSGFPLRRSIVVRGTESLLEARATFAPPVATDIALSLEVLDGGRVEWRSLAPRVFGDPASVIRVAGEGSTLTGPGMPISFSGAEFDFPVELGAGGRIEVESASFVNSDPSTVPERLWIELDESDAGAGPRFDAPLSSAAGRLRVTLADGFVPSAGQQFQLYPGLSPDGDVWDDIVLPEPPAGFEWDLPRLIRDGRLAVSCPSPADLAPPFGIIDLDDIDAFLARFFAVDLSVDFVPPFGIIDLDDVDAFITAFVAGCG